MGARELLLTRRGLAFIEKGPTRAPENHLRAVELRLAQLGYVTSARLRARLGTLAPDELRDAQAFLVDTLRAHRGASEAHVPLFRRFPEDVPSDTTALWIRKVLVHFVQGADQPCLFCRRRGTTHVLSPCRHVVCDACFDGSSYSACPVCEHHVDRSSPFFAPAPDQVPSATERVRFELLDLGEDLGDALEALFRELTLRKQVMSPDDVAALGTLVSELGLGALDVLPEEVPVKENIAHVFGALLRTGPIDVVFPAARAHLATATDLLRLIAAYSGADPSLQAKTEQKVFGPNVPQRWFPKKARVTDGLDANSPATLHTRNGMIRARTRRFRVAPLRRPLRRAMLAFLDGLPFDALVEDLGRHASLWRWVGELLHPFEYAKETPRAALAFAVIRETQLGDDTLAAHLRALPERSKLDAGPNGSLVHHTFAARVEAASLRRDVDALVALLSTRPGELARRADHLLRLALDAGHDPALVVDALERVAPRLATPLLTGLTAHFPRRTAVAPVRVYWPKGQVTTGVSAEDRRRPLPEAVTTRVAAIAERTLLERFREAPRRSAAVIDDQLAGVTVPFNERTAARAMVPVPRGSRVPIAGLDSSSESILRLFLHWCQPVGGQPTDLDLSIGFFDESFAVAGVCSYYALKLVGKRAPGVIAQSSGDLRDAPFPDGATELVDLDLARARAEGLRWAALVVTAYAGLPFGQLERAYAGVMLRSEADGAHFDPRTVALKFALQGEHGVYLPMLVDLDAGVVHWLDVHAKGKRAFNNVANAEGELQKQCKDLTRYFASGTRPSMRDLALLHAAARSDTVYLRGTSWVRELRRRDGEDAGSFLERLRSGSEDRSHATLPPLTEPVLAALFRGDADLPEGSDVWVLFPERARATIGAASLLT